MNTLNTQAQPDNDKQDLATLTDEQLLKLVIRLRKLNKEQFDLVKLQTDLHQKARQLQHEMAEINSRLTHYIQGSTNAYVHPGIPMQLSNSQMQQMGMPHPMHGLGQQHFPGTIPLVPHTTGYLRQLPTDPYWAQPQHPQFTPAAGEPVSFEPAGGWPAPASAQDLSEPGDLAAGNERADVKDDDGGSDGDGRIHDAG